MTALPLLAIACGAPSSAPHPNAGGLTSATSAIPWYETIDNTPSNPERRRAGEPDIADRLGGARPLSRDQAMEMLLRTDWFCSTAVGVAARTPNQCHAFKTLLAQPDAPAAFESLLHRAGPAGQLYALCGLYLVDRSRFDVVVKPYLTSEVPVGYLNGCVGDGVPTRRLVAGDEFNIVGGGWPNAFCRVPELKGH